MIRLAVNRLGELGRRVPRWHLCNASLRVGPGPVFSARSGESRRTVHKPEIWFRRRRILRGGGDPGSTWTGAFARLLSMKKTGDAALEFDLGGANPLSNIA